MDMVLHPTTSDLITRFVKKPSHCVLLSARLGSGKLFVAQHLASQLLGISELKLSDHPYYLQEGPVNSTITITTIRNLKGFMQLRTTGSRPIRRIVVIEQAEMMTQEAQNALLKLLEEPPLDSVIILTASQPQKLLSTIISRVQVIPLKKPPKDEVINYFTRSYPKEAVIKAYYMSDGRIGLMWALLAAKDGHPIAGSIQRAKKLLQSSTYERLLEVNNLSTGDIRLFLASLYSVAHAALAVALEKKNQSMIEQWYLRCKVIHEAEKQFDQGSQPKLLLTNLLLNV
jgi:DNA polymerase III delta prime subunit